LPEDIGQESEEASVPNLSMEYRKTGPLLMEQQIDCFGAEAPLTSVFFPSDFFFFNPLIYQCYSFSRARGPGL
jgi:hypothetical protein